ncbi:MAG: glycoside hydrolase family 2 TIM barrel-domain containing protein [Verrucomicrobiota bacterium]
MEPFVSNRMWQGTAHYRKTFDYKPAWQGKKVFIEFEGAMIVAKISLNGEELTTHYGGYVGFVVDLTDALNAGTNLLEVELDNRDNPNVPPGKPYSQLDFAWFSGLYRNVKLHVKSPLHITHPLYANQAAGGGVFVTYPEISESKAQINVKTHVRNDSNTAQEFLIQQSLFHVGEQVVEMKGDKVSLKPGEDAHYTQTIRLDQPKLWSIQSPNLYRLQTSILTAGGEVDRISERIGLRHISVNSEGFLINGRNMYLRGTNRHQEFPYVGYAASDEAHFRDAQKIKEAGFDLIRLAHYPHAPAFYDACDELGIVLIDCISGWQFFKGNGPFAERSFEEARRMIRRDRNHPSVIMWETSLNEARMPDSFLKKMHQIVDEEYPGDQSISIAWKNKYHDVFGAARQHAKGPKFWDDWSHKNGMGLLVAEYGDWEYFGKQNAFNFNQTAAKKKDLHKDELTSRQKREHGEARMLQQALNYQEAHNQNRRGKSIIGDATWLVIDYNRGNARNHCTSGVLDLMRIPKFALNFFKSQRPASEQSDLFDSGPMVFAATYWNEKSDPSAIRVFSNCEEVSISVNGKEIARQKPDQNQFSTHLEHPPFTFNLGSFVPGELVATAYIDGKPAAYHTVKTPGKPVGLQLFTAKGIKPLQADGADFVFVYAAVVDAQGIIVDNADNELQFSVKGARIVGPDTIAAEAGINGVLVGQTNRKGDIQVQVSSQGLQGTSLSLTAK